MMRSLRLFIATALICAFLTAFSRPAEAQSIPISQGQAVGIVVIFAAVVAAVTVAIYYTIRRPPSITGCAIAAATSLTLQNEADQQTFNLTGDIAAIKPGNRIRVKGKKKNKDASGNRTFLVDKLSKDFGPCKAAP